MVLQNLLLLDQIEAVFTFVYAQSFQRRNLVAFQNPLFQWVFDRG